MDIGSKLGIGTYAVCGAYGTKNKDDIKDTLLLALKNQIGLMDTSDSYDDAEELVGSIIGPY